LRRRRALLLAGAALAAAPGAALAVGGADPIVVVAGNGSANANGSTGDGGPATSADVYRPRAAAADGAGRVYIAQRGNSGVHSAVRLVGTDGLISRFAGDYTAAGYAGDNGPATSALMAGPTGIAVDPGGNVYVAEENNGLIRRITPAGVIGTLVSGLNGVRGIATDAAGNVYAPEAGLLRVIRVSPAGAVTPLAGAGQLTGPGGVAVDGAGNVYVADGARVLRIATNGVVAPIAGTGVPGFSGDGGPALNAQLQAANGVAVDRAGNVYISEVAPVHRIRKVDRSGIITTIAGTGAAGFAGNGGPAANATLSTPFGLSVDAAGSLLIGDEGSGSVRKIVNVPPAASFNVAPAGGPAPLPVSVDASASSGINDPIVSHSWDFGDGATASGPTAQHTYDAAGTYTITLTVMDDSGATASATRQVAIGTGAGPGGLTLRRASFQPTWRVSRLSGRLVVLGNVRRAARLQALVLRASGGGKPLLARRFRVAKGGAFTVRIPLRGLLPGRYRIRVRDVGATRPRLVTQDRLASLKAPPEGVVTRAWISTVPGGRPRHTIARGPALIFASFRFAAVPRRRPLVVSWYWSKDDTPPTSVNRRRPSRLVTAFLGVVGTPLPAGIYRAEARAGGTLVAKTTIRVR